MEKQPELLQGSKEWAASEHRYEKMPYRRSGRSGVLLPPVSLGLWKNFGGESSFAKSLEMLHYAFDHGITHFDLANNYGPPYGSAEETFGKAMLHSFSRYRDELFISTKAGYDMWPGPYGNWGSRKYLVSSLNQSLKRMQLDYVDLFYIHRFDPLTPIEETLQALVDLIKQGKTLYVGISRWPLKATQCAVQYLRERDVNCLVYQGRLNLLSREPEESGILNFLKEQEIGFVSFSPLAQGLLTEKYLSGIVPNDSRMALNQTLHKETLTPELLHKLTKLEQWATAHGERLSSLALLWILSHQTVTSTIVGVSSTTQLKENIETAQKQMLTREEMLEIEQLLK